MKKEKRCKTCGKKKLLKEYHVAKDNKDGRRSNCKLCTNLQKRIDRAREKKEHKKPFIKRQIKKTDFTHGSILHLPVSDKFINTCNDILLNKFRFENVIVRPNIGSFDMEREKQSDKLTPDELRLIKINCNRINRNINLQVKEIMRKRGVEKR